ncbi:MAG: hypothetical protein HY553_12245 [Elusimicrobia bacterium]|nr:hypothetical protein [Elusimicrobiota bacterium]
MKYWVFQNNQVIGPFDREAISQVAGFSAETLVCPEGRKGTQMGDWQRAGVVPEMAESLLAATRTPVLTRAGGERGAGSMLPPEPTLRDLAVLGSLQERVAQLETSSQKMHDELRAKDTEISRLKVELDQKSRGAAEMQTKLADLEVKAYGLAGVKDELERAKEDARVSSIKLEEHQRALEELREKLAKGAPMPAPEVDPFRPQTEPPGASTSSFPSFPMGGAPGADAPLAGLSAPMGEAPLGGALGGAVEAAGAASPMGGPKPGGMGRIGEFQPPSDPFSPPGPAGPGESFRAPAPGTVAVKPPEPVAADPFALPSSSMPPGDPVTEPLVSLGGPPPGLGGAPLAAAPPPLVPVGDLVEPQKQPRDKRVFIAIGVMVVAMITGVALLGGGKKKKKKAQGPTLTAQPAPVTPKPIAEPALDLTQAAVDFVKGYQIPGRQETVAMLLESRYPATGNLSPWMVEKIENDRYQVNFYASQAEKAPGPKPEFQFQVHVKAKLLRGMNPPALSLLNDGSLPAPESARPKRAPVRRSRRAAGGDGGVDAAAAVLEGLKAGTKAAEPPRARKAKPAAAQPGSQETQLPPEEPAGGGDVQIGGAKSEEDEMLDQLLLPGMDKKTPVKKK